MVLIGSRALLLRDNRALSREPVDFDFVCTREEYNEWMEKNAHRVKPLKVYELPEHSKQVVEGEDAICEFEIVKPGSSSEMLVELVDADADTFDTPFGKIPSLDLLFAIKTSHRYRKFEKSSVGFWKTAIDWHSMKRCGAVVRDEYKEFLKLREQETYAKQRHPKLNVSKDEFFTDIFRWDHDDIHKSVAIYERPAYTYYLKDGEQVLCDKAKFFSCSEEIRLAGVCEEALTLGLERSYIPNKGVWSADFAFQFALGKVATSITSGWFREYAHNHLFQVIELYKRTSKNYFEKFDKALAEGKIKPFSGSTYGDNNEAINEEDQQAL